MTSQNLTRVLAATGPILLDFDGPVCSIFAGYPAPAVATHLMNFLTETGQTFGEALSSQHDPLQFLRELAAIADQQLVTMTDHELTSAEVSAAHTAQPTPGGHELLLAAARAHRQVIIVSNNSAAAITAYLADHDLTGLVEGIIGRELGRPQLMKPDPHSVRAAIAQVGAQPGDCVLIGDSDTDITAARSAGVRSIGFANKPGKFDRLRAAGADAVVQVMTEIAEAL